MKKRTKKAPAEDASKLDRLALAITERVGTMMFFVLVFVWTASWLLWNMFGPKNLRFDPFPGFVFWLFISNMIQLFLMPLIMIGQNLQSRTADERAENDYQVNCKAEAEIQEVKAKLDFILKHFKIEPPPVAIEEPPKIEKPSDKATASS
ncbi:MAG TPA: DUF1003 domain-containing protein [Acidisarcina sp.]